MKDLTDQEKERLLRLSKKFIKVHQDIFKIEDTIRSMQERSLKLIDELDKCRNTEKDFIKDLTQKYGNGSLDPLTLTWNRDEIRNEIR
jgi:MoxR-like ATPase